MLASFSVNSMRYWGIRGGIAILDQGLFSGANFIVGVLIARWLSRWEYGTYVLAFTVLLIFYQIHQSFITDPMGVLGPANYSAQLRDYLLIELRLHFAVTLPLGLLTWLVTNQVASALNNDTALIARVLGMMGLSLPFALLPWFLRRSFYVLRRPEESLLGSVIYVISALSALLIFRALNLLSSASAILVLGVAGFLSGSVLFWRLYATPSSHIILPFQKIFLQNWDYARWLVASSLFMVVAGQAQVFIAGHVLSVEAAGVVRVMQTFIQPMILMIGAISALATPNLSYEYASNKVYTMKRKVFLITSALLAASITFEGLLFFLRYPLEYLLYGGKFGAYADLIPIWGIIPILLSLYWGAAIGLQAAQKPQAVMIVSFLWMPASISLGYLFTQQWNLWGASVSAVIGYVLIALICWLLYTVWVTGDANAV